MKLKYTLSSWYLNAKPLADEQAAERIDEHDGDSFTSYILDDFVIYRPPDIKSLSKEGKEGEDLTAKAKQQSTQDREAKGQGEFELPSAVYVAWSVKSLGIPRMSLSISQRR
jgi:hypothetical protein